MTINTTARRDIGYNFEPISEMTLIQEASAVCSDAGTAGKCTTFALDHLGREFDEVGERWCWRAEDAP